MATLYPWPDRRGPSREEGVLLGLLRPPADARAAVAAATAASAPAAS